MSDGEDYEDDYEDDDAFEEESLHGGGDSAAAPKSGSNGADAGRKTRSPGVGGVPVSVTVASVENLVNRDQFGIQVRVLLV